MLRHPKSPLALRPHVSARAQHIGALNEAAHALGDTIDRREVRQLLRRKPGPHRLSPTAADGRLRKFAVDGDRVSPLRNCLPTQAKVRPPPHCATIATNT
jgi:hypothetical protein